MSRAVKVPKVATRDERPAVLSKAAIIKAMNEERVADFLRALAKRSIRPPEREWQFFRERKWRFDFAWPVPRIALEVEGGVWSGGRHTRGSGFLADMEKYNAAALIGWRVLRCTPDTLALADTLEMIEIALSAVSR